MTTKAETSANQSMTFDEVCSQAWDVLFSPFAERSTEQESEAAKARFAVFLQGVLAGRLSTAWIPVEDHLPFDSDEVLLYRPDAHLSQDPHYRIAFYKNGQWSCSVQPTHWMPLPTPPGGPGPRPAGLANAVPVGR